MSIGEAVYSRVLAEQHQGHETRRPLFEILEKHLGRPVVSFFSNMSYGLLQDADADMLQSILQDMDVSRGFALVINSPGGDGIAAERLISVCRTYSGTGEYWAIVPGKAKSAATMVCFGASKILMSGTSELGPVDPQIFLRESRLGLFSVHNLVKTYRTLFKDAVSPQEGNLEPYIQQLQRFDESEIVEFEAAIKLSEDIAVRSLESGMLSGHDLDSIREKIKVFTVPDQVLSHSRPINSVEAQNCGLNVEHVDVHTDWWKKLHELYIRSDNYVSVFASKCMESKSHSFYGAIPRSARSAPEDEE